jgi:zinc transport system substrate-binding protein
VGEGLENFLEKPLKSIVKKAEKIELMETKGLKKLEFRERNIFKEHDGHGHDEHKEHGHKEDKHDDHHGHAHGKHDPHIWLDPINAKTILSEMAEHLIEKDPNNASTYKANLKKAHKALDNLTKKVKSELKKDFNSIVFHDAYQYFEKRFDVNVLGAFTVNTDVLPGAEQLAKIREIIEHEKVTCVFSEPQFNPDIIKAVAKDTNIKTGVIDPLGATLNPGKDLYFDLIRNMYASFKSC